MSEVRLWVAIGDPRVPPVVRRPQPPRRTHRLPPIGSLWPCFSGLPIFGEAVCVGSSNLVPVMVMLRRASDVQGVTFRAAFVIRKKKMSSCDMCFSIRSLFSVPDEVLAKHMNMVYKVIPTSCTAVVTVGIEFAKVSYGIVSLHSPHCRACFCSRGVISTR